MAKLGQYIDERPLGTGSEFMRARPVTDQTAKAGMHFANVLGNLGGQLQAEDDKLDAKAKGIAERDSKLMAVSDQIRMDTEQKIRLQTATENISESGAGFYDSYMGEYDKAHVERMKGLPDNLKPEMELAFLKDREGMAVHVAGIEAGQRRAFLGKVTKEKAVSLSQSVLTGGMTHEQAVSEIPQFTAGLGLPPNQLRQVERDIGLAIDAAHIQKTINEDPSGAIRDINAYSPNAIRPRTTGTFPVLGVNPASVPTSGGSANSREHMGPRGGGSHAGWDIPAPVGTPVVGVGTGVVVAKGSGQGYGEYVDVKYEDGTIHRMAHLGDVSKGGNQSAFAAGVDVGAKVEKGQEIGYTGYSGNAGRDFTHVHYEIFPNQRAYESAKGESSRATAGMRINPRTYFQNKGAENSAAIQNLTEAAQRHGIDPIIVLSQSHIEANWNPNMDMSSLSGKINPRTGRAYPKMTSSGLGGMTEENWKETGIAKSNDPAIQAEAFAVLTRKRIESLQANNIEVTPSSVWGAHLLGPGTYAALVAANPDTPLRDVMLPRYGAAKYEAATNSNGALLKDGMTAGQVLSAINDKVGESVQAAQNATEFGTPQQNPKDLVTIGGVTAKYMTGQDLPQYMGHALNAVRKQADQRMVEAAKSQAFERQDVNSYDPHDRSEADKAFRARGIGDAILKGDTGAQGETLNFAQRHGFLPASAAAAAQKLMTEVDISKKVQGYELGLAAHAVDSDNGLQFSSFDKQMADRVKLYAATREIDGMSQLDAVRRVERIMSPENQKQAQTPEFQARIKEASTAMTWRDLASKISLNGGRSWSEFFTGANDQTPRSEKLKDFMLDRARESFVQHARAYNDVEAAKSAAYTDIKKMVGPTSIFGATTVSLFPPEKFLQRGPDGTFDYVRQQAMTLVNEAASDAAKHSGITFGTIDPKNIILKPTANTWLDKKAGRQPEYDLLYLNKAEQRIEEVRPGWRPDASAAFDNRRAGVEPRPSQMFGPPAPTTNASVVDNDADGKNEAGGEAGEPKAPAPTLAPSGLQGIRQQRAADQAKNLELDQQARERALRGLVKPKKQ